MNKVCGNATHPHNTIASPIIIFIPGIRMKLLILLTQQEQDEILESPEGENAWLVITEMMQRQCIL